MAAISMLSFLLASLSVTVFGASDLRRGPSSEQLAKSGWPSLSEGETPTTIVLPNSLGIQYCSKTGSCKLRHLSVLQDGGFRLTSPQPQGQIANEGSSLITTYTGDNRFYFGQPQLANSSVPITSFDKNSVEVFDLTNKRWEFDVDLSSVGCNCDASMYFYSYNPSSSSTGTAKDPMRNLWYLDAQSSPGVPEMDILEGCSHQTTSSIHTCKSESNGSYAGCSGMGELWRALSPFDWFNKPYGPGGSKIDTRKKFNVAASFNVDGQQWNMEVTLSQSSKAGVGPSQQISSSFKTKPRADVGSLKWMRPAMSLWGNPNNGLQMTPFYAPQCNPLGAGCDYKSAQVTYSNFKITDLVPTPSEFLLI